MNLLLKNLIAIAVIILLLSISYFVFKSANTLKEKADTERDIAQSHYGYPKIFKEYAEMIHSMNKNTRLSDMASDSICKVIIKDTEDVLAKAKTLEQKDQQNNGQ